MCGRRPYQQRNKRADEVYYDLSALRIASGIFLQEIIHAGVWGKRQKTASFFCDSKGLQFPVLAASVNAQIAVQNLLKAGVFRKVQFIFLFAV